MRRGRRAFGGIPQCGQRRDGACRTPLRGERRRQNSGDGGKTLPRTRYLRVKSSSPDSRASTRPSSWRSPSCSPWCRRSLRASISRRGSCGRSTSSSSPARVRSSSRCRSPIFRAWACSQSTVCSARGRCASIRSPRCRRPLSIRRVPSRRASSRSRAARRSAPCRSSPPWSAHLRTPLPKPSAMKRRPSMRRTSGRSRAWGLLPMWRAGRCSWGAGG